jgi:hypothetical protein
MNGLDIQVGYRSMVYVACFSKQVAASMIVVDV